MNHNSPNLLARLLPAIVGLAAAVRVNAQEYTFTTLVGPAETPGAIDGRGSAARFNYQLSAGRGGRPRRQPLRRRRWQQQPAA